MLIKLKAVRHHIHIAIILCLSSLKCYPLNFLTVITHPDVSHSKIFRPLFYENDKFLFYKGLKSDKNIVGYYKLDPALGWVHYKLDLTNELLDIASGPNNTIAALLNAEGLGTFVSTTKDIKSWQTQHFITNSYDVILNRIKLHGVDNLIVYDFYQNFPTNLKNIIYSSNDGFQWTTHELPFPWTWASWDFNIEHKYVGEVFNEFISLQYVPSLSAVIFFVSNDFIHWSKTAIPFNNDRIDKVFNNTNIFAVTVKNEQKNYHKLWVTFDLQSWVDFLLPFNTELNDFQSFKNNRLLMLLNHENNYSAVDDKATELVLLNMENKDFKILQKFDGNVTNLSYVNNDLYLSGDFINPVDNVRAALAIVNLD
ncbi:MAG: hypothetical protein KBD64_02005 [Gammaproteobacteria bacterium]|nr:hypothetical protein [Gammaproteobacteria bacterium]